MTPAQRNTHARLLRHARGAMHRASTWQLDPRGIHAHAWLRVAHVFLRCASKVRRGEI